MHTPYWIENNNMSPWPGEKAVQTLSILTKQESQVALALDGGMEYRTRMIQEGLYLVHWIDNNQIHIALLFDFINKKTTCAALMPGLWDIASWDRWQLLSAALKKYHGKSHP